MKIIKEEEEKYRISIGVTVYKEELKNYRSLEHCINILHDVIYDHLESNKDYKKQG